MLFNKLRNNLYAAVILFILLAPEALANECKKEQNEYRKIQKRMNQPYSFSQGEKLRSRERNLFSIFQACMNGGISETKKKKRKSDKKLRVSKNNKNSNTRSPSNLGITKNKRLVIRGKFTGPMQSAWLKYYKIPKGCSRPKSTSAFAWCIEHKNNSAKTFKKQWQTNKIID